MQVGILEKINAIYEKLGAIDLAGKLFSPETVAAFQELDNLNISLIVEDFKKGNYLGNRKIDIDLNLNNKSTTSVPTYQKVNIILIDGTNLEMPFDNGSGGVLELSSHGDIKNFIVNHNLFTQIEDTEIVLLEAFADTPAMIRFRDADGKASNIERIELFAYSGSVYENKVNYFWAKTTSALETLANRVGDIIKIGNNFDPMILLSNKADELVIMQTKINELMTIYSNLNTILSSKNDALAASESATFAFQNSKKAEDSAVLASQKAESASDSASMAAEKLSKIQSITVQGQTLTAGQNVAVSYNPITNKFTFSIPQGEKGDKGESFRVNSIGTIAERALYDNELANFSYLASDVEIEGSTIPHIYFKKSNTAGDWTTGIPFGRGEKGDKGDAGVGISSISRTDGYGSAGQTDVYTITLTDGNTHEFSVYNGKDSDINLSDLTTLSNVMQNSLNQKINISDIKDSLTSTDTTKPLSANQGKVLKELIDNINTIITSDDTTLDQMQEVVNFIKQNKTDLQNLDLSNIAETTTLKHFTAILKTKLDAIAENANNYSHPSTHDASMITESTTKRFVSDTEKTSWNAKLDASSGTPAGTIILFASPTVPAGHLKANGALVSRTAYSALFAAIGTTFGAGDGSTTFALPDLRAYFPRGWDDGRGIDVGRVFGSTQQDDFKSHTHANGFGASSSLTSTTVYSNNNKYVDSSQPLTAVGGVETRPKNIALLYCIKY